MVEKFWIGPHPVIEVTCTEAQWRAMPESATTGRRCSRCISLGFRPPGLARYTHQHGSLCRWCAEIDGENVIKEFGESLTLQAIIDVDDRALLTP